MAISCVADFPKGKHLGNSNLGRPLFGNSLDARGYQLFGRNYQAEVPDSALPLRHATRTSRRFDGEKTMESFADGIGNLIGFHLVLGFMFSIYLAPSIIAVVRGHHRWPWIGFLNLAAGLDRRRLDRRPGVVSDRNTPASSDDADRQHCT